MPRRPRSNSQESHLHVEHVTLSSATRLVTLDWPWPAPPSAERVKGAIVRVRQCAADDGTFIGAVDALRKVARKVSVIPYRHRDRLPAKIVAKVEAKSVRQVVSDLVAASPSKDRDALWAIVESVMGGCGL